MNSSLFVPLFLFFLLSHLASQAQCNLGSDFLGQDTIACESFTLGPIQGLSNIMWNSDTSLTDDSLMVYISGLYWIDGTDSQGNSCNDTIRIIVNPAPFISLGPDQMICSPTQVDLCNICIANPGCQVNAYYFDSLTLDFELLPPCSYWIDSTTTLLVELIDPNGCISRDTIIFYYQEAMQLQFTTYPDFGQNEGAVKVHVMGGTPPYLYQLNSAPASPQDSLVGLAAGQNYLLTVTDAMGCISQDTFSIPYARAVYPGDCNHDQIVDMCDLFQIGLHLGTFGLMRPQASLQWTPQPSPLWNQTQSNSKDLRHVDCNGDGLIHWSDTSAILLNYSQTHNNQRNGFRTDGLPIYATWNRNVAFAGEEKWLDIFIGKIDTQVTGLYGLALDFQIDTFNIEVQSIKLSLDSSWLGMRNRDLIALKREAQFSGNYNVGMVRIDQLGMNGWGKVLRMRFRVKASAMISDPPITLSFLEAKAIDRNGEEIQLHTANSQVPIDDGMYMQDDLQYSIRFFPQPALDKLHISHQNKTITDLKLYDFQGKRLDISYQLGPEQSTLFVEMLPPGLYWLKLERDKQIGFYTIVIQ